MMDRERALKIMGLKEGLLTGKLSTGILFL